METFSQCYISLKPPEMVYDSSLRTYFIQLEDFFYLANIKSDSERISYFRLGLRSQDLLKCCIDVPLPSVYEDFKEALLLRYEPPCYPALSQDEFFNSTQDIGESILSYKDRLFRLCKHGYPGVPESKQEKLVLLQLKNSISNHRLRERAMRSTTTDVESFARELHFAEQTSNFLSRESCFVPQLTDKELLNLRIEQLTEQIKELVARSAQQKRAIRPIRRMSWDSSRSGKLAQSCCRNITTHPDGDNQSSQGQKGNEAPIEQSDTAVMTMKPKASADTGGTTASGKTALATSNKDSLKTTTMPTNLKCNPSMRNAPSRTGGTKLPAAQINATVATLRLPNQEPLTKSMLANAPPQEQKQMIGERLFPLVHDIFPNLSGKITGMLLEIDNAELFHMLESQSSLKSKIDEAAAVLHAHQVGKLQ